MVTVTLPEATIARLATIDPDRAHAIVKATDAALPTSGEGRNPVELVEIQPGMEILIVGPSQYLQRITWLRLVQVAPLRYLVVLPTGTVVDSLEIAITDLLEGMDDADLWEGNLLEQLRSTIRGLRREGRFSKAELLLIDSQRPPQ
jgi:hypothetical protein